MQLYKEVKIIIIQPKYWAIEASELAQGPENETTIQSTSQCAFTAVNRDTK